MKRIVPLNKDTRPYFIDEVMKGTEEEAEAILRASPGFKVIPGTQYMNTPMIAKCLGFPKIGTLYTYIAGYGFNTQGIRACWDNEKNSGLFGIKQAIQEYYGKPVGSLSYKVCQSIAGLPLNNGTMKLYTPRTVLALGIRAMRMPPQVMKRLERSVFADRVYENLHPAPPPEITVSGVNVNSEEFISQLVELAIREALKAVRV